MTQEFTSMLDTYQGAVSTRSLGFVCHPDKCKAIDGSTALETIQLAA
ncbi:MAG TPA: hypothetical protein VGV63_09225 [Acidimicrobiales bacterium]|nr:hypothetical protein [Acidimicrobiales bacterium]